MASLKMINTMVFTKGPFRPYETERKLHYAWVLLPLIVAGGLYTGSYYLFHNLPEPLSTSSGSNTDRFIELNAWTKLQELSRIGTRLVGSEANEIDAIKFLIDAIEEIKSEALAKYKIEYEVQNADFGSYILDDMVDIYKDIKNFIVKFSSLEQESEAALLVNSHYDTVPESSGTGDDGTMVAVMLEILRVLSTQTKSLKHPVIFLFNGAEENSLQGSHAFITQHSYAKDIKAFINLDVAGMGGREMLFQSGPGHPWLLEYYYQSSMHPYATTVAEEVFQNNLIPSDTDYRIFRDYGNIPGLDLAQSYNGFVYHTKLDRLDAMSASGSLQNTGDNVLGLIKSIASSKQLENPNEYSEGHTVFFDFLGLFLIYYTETTGLIINISVAIISLLAIAISVFFIYRTMDIRMSYLLKKLAITFLIQLATLILAVGVTILLAVIIDAVNAPLFWYSQQWLIFGIYFCPYCFIMAIIPAMYLNMRESELPLRSGIQLFLHSYCIILIVLVAIMTILSIRSAFAVTFGIFFYTLSVIINWASGLQKRAFSWLIPILLLQTIPFIFYSYLSQMMYTTFIPITGRSGCTNQSEILISVFTIVIALLITGFLAPLFSICRKAKIIISGFALVFVAFVIILATSLAFPFTKDVAPQRHWVFHTERTLYDENGIMSLKDSGYVLLPLDRYAPTTIEEIISGREYKSTGEDCSRMLVCGVPVYASNFKFLSNYSYWIQAEEPMIPDEYKPEMHLISKTLVDSNIIRYNMEIVGPAHLQVFFNPLDECELVGWSVSDEFPTKEYFKESMYFLTLRHGRNSRGFEFYLEFKVPDNYEDSVFDIALIAHHSNYPVQFTNGFKEFLSIYPDWVTLTPIVSSYIGMRF